jgi:GTP-binding protein
VRFIDEATIEVAAGDGGNGCMSFLRMRFVPKGGPDGGDGGRGGDVILLADNSIATLADHSYLRHFKAKRGAHGEGADKYGRSGEDKIIRVPVGTMVFDVETGEQVADLTQHDQLFVAAKGGKGGKGNRHFATSTNRAPRKTTPGKPGERRTLRLELKLLADVGLVGLPNAGKSSLIRTMSRARPKVADYPFTTLTPNLGVVQLPGRPPFTVADIPGLVEGAHTGAGLGLKFLKHVERTRLFLYVVDINSDDPIQDLNTVISELNAYDQDMSRQVSLVAANKLDLDDAREIYPIFKEEVEAMGLTVIPISAATGQGVRPLIQSVYSALFEFGGENGDG